jgi:hypothetical protein
MKEKMLFRRGMILFLYAVVFGFTTGEIRSQNPMGAGSVGMGMTAVSATQTSWAVFNNPALMSTETGTVSFYAFRYAGFAELTDMAAAVSIPTRAGTFGVGAHRYGFDLFSENRFLAGWKYRFEQLHFGVAATWHHIVQGGGYGSAGALGVDIGFAADLLPVLRFGARATNINQPAYGGSNNGSVNEYLPRELAAELTLKASDMLTLAAGLVKDVRFPLSVRSGIQFEPVTSLAIRAGFTTEPGTWSFGAGYTFSRFGVNLAMQQHDPLGLSPAMDITVEF